jgi:murein DD-endopeptidase MepM/ murein hydrolase activator NlpD
MMPASSIQNRMPGYAVLCFATAVFALLCLGARPAPPAELTVSHRARSLQPGEVVLLTVECPQPLKDLKVTVFGKDFPLFPKPDSSAWQGLIGIDAEVKAGRYPVEVLVKGIDGQPFHSGHLLEIRGKQFPTRVLTVDEKYVTPPESVQERIRIESERVEKIFAALTARRLWDGAFVVPVQGSPTSSFGRRNILNGKPRSPHWGTDFTAEVGTPVMSPNSGRVVLASELYFSGNTIILDHGLGLYSFLAHLSRITVNEGDEVKAGQLLGRAGATGRVTGPHLHWTVRLMGARVDPLSLIAALAGE